MVAAEHPGAFNTFLQRGCANLKEIDGREQKRGRRRRE